MCVSHNRRSIQRSFQRRASSCVFSCFTCAAGRVRWVNRTVAASARAFSCTISPILTNTNTQAHILLLFAEYANVYASRARTRCFPSTSATAAKCHHTTTHPYHQKREQRACATQIPLLRARLRCQSPRAVPFSSLSVANRIARSHSRHKNSSEPHSSVVFAEFADNHVFLAVAYRHTCVVCLHSWIFAYDTRPVPVLFVAPCPSVIPCRVSSGVLAYKRFLGVCVCLCVRCAFMYLVCDVRMHDTCHSIFVTPHLNAFALVRPTPLTLVAFASHAPARAVKHRKTPHTQHPAAASHRNGIWRRHCECYVGVFFRGGGMVGHALMR